MAEELLHKLVIREVVKALKYFQERGIKSEDIAAVIEREAMRIRSSQESGKKEFKEHVVTMTLKLQGAFSYKGEVKSEDMKTFLGFLRDLVSDKSTPEERLATYALKKAQDTVESETKKRGKNSFWMIPE